MAPGDRSRERHRHVLPDPTGPKPRHLPLHQPRQPGRTRRHRARIPRRRRRRRPGTLLPRRPVAVPPGPPVPGRAPAHLARARQRRRPPRRRHRPRGERLGHGQRGGPPPNPGHALGLLPARGLGPDQPPGRLDRGAPHLRLQPPARLPHRLPHQRRHRHPRRRDAPPARAGPHQADREGLPRPPQDQPRGARPLRRGHPGVRATSTRSPTSRPWARARPNSSRTCPT